LTSAREEEQVKVREEEEKNWQQAMSGELSGPRKAALGAAEGVSEVIKAVEGEGGLDDLAMEDDKEEFLYTAFYKILSGLRRQEDSWVFEDPVTESIAPGYHEQISMPMDYSTVESRLEKRHYSTREEFETDVKLIFNNCIEYNGVESEYSELANQMLIEFQKLCKVHLDGGGVKAEPEMKTKGSRSSRSPSVCKTPELTSESSSEEASDEDSDESYSEGTGKPKKKASGTGGGLKPLLLTPKLSQQLPHSAAHLPPRPPHPYYHHQMMMQYRMRFDGAPPPHMAPPHPEMMFRPPAYGRPPPPYSQHPHMPRPPPDHHFPSYPPNYPPHFLPSPYHHLHGFRQGFPPHMLSPQQRPHLSPTAAHGRPGSVPPGPNSIPHSSTSTPPNVSDPGSIPHSSHPGSIPESNSGLQEGGRPGKVVGDEEGREEKQPEKGKKKVEDEQGREEKKEGDEAKDGDKNRAERNVEGTHTSDGRETVAENGPIMVQSGPPPPPPHGPHQMSKQQQAAYRYMYQQHMMRAAGGGASHTHPDFYQRYPHGYDPHYFPRQPYPSPPPPPPQPPRPPTSLPSHHPDPYYAWHHQQQAMYGREGRPQDDMQRHQQQQMYWMEMERRRQYYMYMQQRAKAAQMGRSQKPVATSNKQESNELTVKEGGVESSNKSKEEEEEKMEQKASTKREGAKDENRASAHEESETDGGEKERACSTPDTKTPVTIEDKTVPAPSQDENTLAPSKDKVTGPPEDKKTPGAEDREAGVGEERNTPRSAKDGRKTLAAEDDDKPGAGASEREKTTEAHPLLKEPSREMMFRHAYRPPPFPPHPHNGHPALEGGDMYSYPPSHHMYPPHMYVVPPGYGMRQHPSNYRPHPPYNEQGFPPYQSPGHEQGVAVGNTSKTGDQQGIPPTQRPMARGVPPGYLSQREGFPPMYGPRPEHHEMRAPPNEQGLPPGYGAWPRHHSYPQPMDPGMMSSEARERWKMGQSASHYQHMHPHQVLLETSLQLLNSRSLLLPTVHALYVQEPHRSKFTPPSHKLSLHPSEEVPGPVCH
jgi:hypothetical protein